MTQGVSRTLAFSYAGVEFVGDVEGWRGEGGDQSSNLDSIQSDFYLTPPFLLLFLSFTFHDSSFLWRHHINHCCGQVDTGLLSGCQRLFSLSPPFIGPCCTAHSRAAHDRGVGFLHLPSLYLFFIGTSICIKLYYSTHTQHSPNSFQASIHQPWLDTMYVCVARDVPPHSSLMEHQLTLILNSRTPNCCIP